jgi:hypothetical protein
MELWLEDYRLYGLERHLPTLRSPTHKPLLLLVGELLPREEREYFHRYFEEIAPPKALITLTNSDHYCNTGSGAGLVIFDHRVISQTVQTIHRWISQGKTG